MLNAIKRAWCKFMHTRIMWPSHSTYECSQCHEKWEVTW